MFANTGRGATGGLTAKVEGRNVARAGQAPGTRGEQMPDLALARSSSRRSAKGRSAVAPVGSSIRLTTRPGRRPRRSGLLVRASGSPTSLEFTPIRRRGHLRFHVGRRRPNGGCRLSLPRLFLHVLTWLFCERGAPRPICDG